MSLLVTLEVEFWGFEGEDGERGWVAAAAAAVVTAVSCSLCQVHLPFSRSHAPFRARSFTHFLTHSLSHTPE